MRDNDIIEKLAAYEHDRWSRWQKRLFSKCIINQDQSLTISKELIEKLPTEETDEINLYLNIDETNKQ